MNPPNLDQPRPTYTQFWYGSFVRFVARSRATYSGTVAFSGQQMRSAVLIIAISNTLEPDVSRK